MRLTDLSIRALKAPDKGAIIYPDDTLAGFGVRVSQAGTKSYVLTHGVRRQRETIGRVGILGLQEARSEAKRRLAEYTLGKRQNASPAWNSALTEYLALVEQRRKPRTYADYKRLLEKHFRFGETKLAGLTPRDIQQKLDKLSATPAEQQHAFVVIRAFIRWAYKRDYLDRNPMEKMQEPKGYKARDRVLTDHELMKVWNGAGDSTFGKIVKLLMLTGQREMEIAQFERSMLEDDLLSFPASLAKNNIAHTFPIGPVAISIVESTTASGRFLFPARGKPDKPFSGWSKSKIDLDKRSGVSGWRLHDLRRTLRTKWEELGISPAVSERYINHISGVHSGVQGIYNRHKYLPEMRTAVARWEEHLQTLLRLGRQPEAREPPERETRDAALIEEAGARDRTVLTGPHRPLGSGRQVPKKGTSRPRPGRVARARSAGLARAANR